MTGTADPGLPQSDRRLFDTIEGRLPPFDPDLIDETGGYDGSPLSDVLEGMEVIFGAIGKVLLVIVSPVWLPFYIAGRLRRTRREG